MQTTRLKLRQWIPTDMKPFADMNADSEVMKYFPATLNELESNALFERIVSRIAENGWGLWALELADTHEFIGFTGLNKPWFDLPFCPCVEIGWRLMRKHWGKGYATEAANKALEFAFENLSLDEVVAFTPVANFASQAVMKRIHMNDTRENFLHPAIPSGNSLQEHLLFRITAPEWKHSRQQSR